MYILETRHYWFVLMLFTVHQRYTTFLSTFSTPAGLARALRSGSRSSVKCHVKFSLFVFTGGAGGQRYTNRPPPPQNPHCLWTLELTHTGNMFKSTSLNLMLLCWTTSPSFIFNVLSWGFFQWWRACWRGVSPENGEHTVALHKVFS